jgi:hypothetical protein
MPEEKAWPTGGKFKIPKRSLHQTSAAEKKKLKLGIKKGKPFYKNYMKFFWSTENLFSLTMIFGHTKH